MLIAGSKLTFDDSVVLYHMDRTCPVPTFGHAGTNLGRAAGRAQVSRDESGTGRKFTTFGWDEWEVRPEREFSLRSCRETPVSPHTSEVSAYYTPEASVPYRGTSLIRKNPIQWPMPMVLR